MAPSTMVDMSQGHGPPGWPRAVPPPEASGWREAAVPWLLDQCPADYRGYPVWRKHPEALAWVAAKHVAAQVEAMRSAYRVARVELADQVGPEALLEVLAALEAEGLRLRATARATELVAQAMSGIRFVPRL